MLFVKVSIKDWLCKNLTFKLKALFGRIKKIMKIDPCILSRIVLYVTIKIINLAKVCKNSLLTYHN